MSYHRSQSVYLPGRRFTRGLGDAVSTSRNISIGGSLGASAASAVLGSIAASGGTVLGIAASSLIPVVGPIIAGLTMGIQALVANSGCGPTCVITSQWANQAAAKLQELKDAYFALPAPRTDAQKAVVMANMNTVLQALKQNCSQPGTGDAGVRCISDRQAWACTWKQKYAPTYPGDPAIGECWNWDNGYFNAIRQDVTVPDAETSVSDSIASVFGGAPSVSSLPPLAAIAALLFLGARL